MATFARALGTRGDWDVPELRTLAAGIIQLNAFLCIEPNVEVPARSPLLKEGRDASHDILLSTP